MRRAAAVSSSAPGAPGRFLFSELVFSDAVYRNQSEFFGLLLTCALIALLLAVQAGTGHRGARCIPNRCSYVFC